MKEQQNLPKIKSRFTEYQIVITSVVMILMMLVFFWLQGSFSQKLVEKNANDLFQQIETIIVENNKELEETKASYSESCLNRADTVARMLELDPEIHGAAKMKELAKLLEIDEIHLFDENGVIVDGTNPEYYGYSVNDGEQIGFFKQMLDDHSLRLCQDITPNTAAKKLMQYSAVWSKNESFIVQIGMEPVNVTRLTSKNELNYIFRLLMGGSGVYLYALDPVTNTVVGASDTKQIGLSVEEIGFPKTDEIAYERGTYYTINGKRCYCVFRPIEGTVIAYASNSDAMFEDMFKNSWFLAGAIIFIAFLLVFSSTSYIDRYVIRNIDDMNRVLSDISSGEANKTIKVGDTQEFAELSTHMNEMIQALLKNEENLSYLLNQTNLKIGVYEYHRGSGRVRFTERVPELLGLDKEEAENLAEDYARFEQYIETMRKHAVPNETNLYYTEGKEMHYLRFEDRQEGQEVFGIIVDMTEEVLMRRRLESERDIDLLTGLLNRRGLNSVLEKLFEHPEDLKHGVMCMIDADGLKAINDTYGHVKGDQYLQLIGDELREFGNRKHVAGRLGGDEYVLFLHGYETHEALVEDLDKLVLMQNKGVMKPNDNDEIAIRFSLGYALTYGMNDYHAALLAADKAMYQDKLMRNETDKSIRM